MSRSSTRGWAQNGSTTLWRKTRLVVLQRDNWQCMVKGPRCTGVADTVDHVVALVDGGSMYDLNNLRAACARCNYGKGSAQARTPAPGATPALEVRTRW